MNITKIDLHHLCDDFMLGIMVYTIPALMRLKQEDRHKFEARLGCMSRPSLREKKRILIFLPISKQVSSLWHYRSELALLLQIKA